MAEPFLGEIRMMSFNFAPKGWAQCNGGLLPINQNQPLFALFGTTYGGDGRVNFGLPNLVNRVPVGFGGTYTLGQAGGESAHRLTTAEMPQHSHYVVADTTSTQTNPNVPSPTRRLAQSGPGILYGPPNNLAPMNAASIGNTGGSQLHENQQPYLEITFCVALQGIFPSPN